MADEKNEYAKGRKEIKSGAASLLRAFAKAVTPKDAPPGTGLDTLMLGGILAGTAEGLAKKIEQSEQNMEVGSIVDYKGKPHRVAHCGNCLACDRLGYHLEPV